MKIYTKTGDKGTTSLVYGQRVSKTDIRVEAYGTCDEANSLIGLALSFLKDTDFEGKEEMNSVFHEIQTELFHVGAELATPPGKDVRWKLEEGHVQKLERVMDRWDEKLDPLSNFILPGGHPAGAAFHSARTVVRRAERNAVAIEEVNPLVISYLNRLSDFLFVTARFVNHQLGEKEDTLHQ
ncbi:cob(I)yrinic acid a,c-diamide adenosyltransferase [Oikeobacillus pervagus]|uniref:cob(I)yrinic acid a,c-diamide adenosyltransferase n=1 Tax=Oikeobacillus pervagus TaxID=1325931 RepID=UPI0027D910BD|nr:cob(I)yrinic acid a,c-diamide adenosyltransferase [Oikeobacillus pervagus]